MADWVDEAKEKLDEGKDALSETIEQIKDRLGRMRSRDDDDTDSWYDDEHDLNE